MYRYNTITDFSLCTKERRPWLVSFEAALYKFPITRRQPTFSGRCLAAFWHVTGRFLATLWHVNGCCLTTFWHVAGCRLAAFWHIVARQHGCLCWKGALGDERGIGVLVEKQQRLVATSGALLHHVFPLWPNLRTDKIKPGMKFNVEVNISEWWAHYGHRDRFRISLD